MTYYGVSVFLTYNIWHVISSFDTLFCGKGAYVYILHEFSWSGQIYGFSKIGKEILQVR